MSHLPSTELLRRIHPLHRLRAQIGMASAVTVLLLSTILSYIAADISRQHLETSLGEDFAHRAVDTIDVLDRNMFERYREIQIVAGLDDISDPNNPLTDKREILTQLQQSFDAYAWIGICDTHGIGTVGTGHYLEGKDLSKRPWCSQGRDKPFIGDVHDALLLSKLLPNPTGEMFYLLDVAAPVRDRNGQFQGVLCGHIYWRWAAELLNSRRPANTDLLLLDKSGLVLAGPVKARSAFAEIAPHTMQAIGEANKSGYLIERWRDGKTYLVGYARGEGYRDYPGLGWVTVFRQDVTAAFAPAKQLQQHILLAGAGLGLLFAWLGWWLAGRIARPIQQISLAAEKVAAGNLQFSPPAIAGNGEVAHLADSIRGMVAALVQEIAERERAEEGLRLAGKVFENNTEAIVITDADNNIVRVNAAFSEISGYLPDEVIGRNPRLFNSGKQPAEFYQAFWQTLLETGNWQGEIWNKRKDGQIFPEWMIVLLVRDEQTAAVTHHIAIYSDISERKRKEERIQYLANYDVLTGLPNRYLLNDRINQTLTLAQRSGHKVAILFIDLDHFKTINDSLGHDVGDQLLKTVAHRFKNCLRRSDTIARQGGDEFVAVLSDLSSENEATFLAEKMLESLEKDIEIDGHLLSVTPSIGISIYPDDSEDPSVLMRNADMAMYRAKAQGRNNLQFFTEEMNREAVERMEIEMQLRHAIARNELSVVYQPQISLSSGKLVGMESLLRWNNAELGNVSPARFIPVAEESGLIEQIGEWVLRQVCQQGRTWQQQGYALVPLAVNLSARQFRNPLLLNKVAAALRETHFSTAYLELELTESMLMDFGVTSRDVMRQLKEMGIRLSLDDFGTGYSSLSALKSFPLDKLKVDQSFVRDLTLDEDDNAIVRAIVAMGQALGVETIAEGVETEAQLEQLRAMGCDEYQGYLCSRPVPPEQAVQFLSAAATE